MSEIGKPQARSYFAAAQAFRDGADTPRAFLERCIATIEALDPHVGAFVATNLPAARTAADAATVRWKSRTPLSLIDGMPIGIKDIMETADMVTEQGSPLFAGWRGRRDAAAVAALREAGAVILGKAVTTEFAATRDRRPLRIVRGPVHHDHPHGLRPHFRSESTRSRHGPILSSDGASEKAGAVQSSAPPPAAPPSSPTCRCSSSASASARCTPRCAIATRRGSVTQPATGATPLGLGSTGDPIFVVPASLLGTPSMSLPVLQAEGLPLGLQVIGFMNEGAALFAAAPAILPILERT